MNYDKESSNHTFNELETRLLDIITWHDGEPDTEHVTAKFYNRPFWDEPQTFLDQIPVQFDESAVFIEHLSPFNTDPVTATTFKPDNSSYDAFIDTYESAGEAATYLTDIRVTGNQKRLHTAPNSNKFRDTVHDAARNGGVSDELEQVMLDEYVAEEPDYVAAVDDALHDLEYSVITVEGNTADALNRALNIATADYETRQELQDPSHEIRVNTHEYLPKL